MINIERGEEYKAALNLLTEREYEVKRLLRYFTSYKILV